MFIDKWDAHNLLIGLKLIGFGSLRHAVAHVGCLLVTCSNMHIKAKCMYMYM